MGKWIGGMAVVAAAVGIAWTIGGVTGGDPSAAEAEWFGHSVAVLAIALLTMLFAPLGVELSGLVVGKDNRTSTSKVQALAWAYVLAAALLSLIVAKWAGAAAGYDALLSEGLKDEYLLLLGGPFAAAIAARGIVGAKVESGQISKTTGTPTIAQLATDDEGGASLADMQYLLFNFVTMVFFLGTFVTEAADGLPELPELLVGLTGVAAAAYVSNKAVLREAPKLQRIVPPQAAAGASATLYGMSLVLRETAADGSSISHDPQVTFNDVLATVTQAVTVGGYDRVTVTVPAIAGLPAATPGVAPTGTPVTVKAVTGAGAESNELPFAIG
jgi:hypothetical protein